LHNTGYDAIKPTNYRHLELFQCLTIPPSQRNYAHWGCFRCYFNRHPSTWSKDLASKKRCFGQAKAWQ